MAIVRIEFEGETEGLQDAVREVEAGLDNISRAARVVSEGLREALVFPAADTGQFQQSLEDALISLINVQEVADPGLWAEYALAFRAAGGSIEGFESVLATLDGALRSIREGTEGAGLRVLFEQLGLDVGEIELEAENALDLLDRLFGAFDDRLPQRTAVPLLEALLGDPGQAQAVFDLLSQSSDEIDALASTLRQFAAAGGIDLEDLVVGDTTEVARRVEALAEGARNPIERVLALFGRVEELPSVAETFPAFVENLLSPEAFREFVETVAGALETAEAAGPATGLLARSFGSLAEELEAIGRGGAEAGARVLEEFAAALEDAEGFDRAAERIRAVNEALGESVARDIAPDDLIDLTALERVASEAFRTLVTDRAEEIREALSEISPEFAAIFEALDTSAFAAAEGFSTLAEQIGAVGGSGPQRGVTVLRELAAALEDADRTTGAERLRAVIADLRSELDRPIDPESLVDLAAVERITSEAFRVLVEDRTDQLRDEISRILPEFAALFEEAFAPRIETRGLSVLAELVASAELGTLAGDADRLAGALQDVGVAAAGVSFERLRAGGAEAARLITEEFERSSAAIRREIFAPVDPDSLVDIAAAGRIAAEVFNRAVEERAEELEPDIAAGLLDDANALEDAFEGLGRSTAQFFANLVTDFEDAGRAAERFLNILVRIAFEALLTSALGEGGLGIPGFQHGGFHTGGLALVGEGGPELISTGPARIFSADDTARIIRESMEDAGGGVTINVTGALDRQDVERILIEQLPRIQSAVGVISSRRGAA